MSCKADACIKGLPSDLAAHDRLSTRQHAFRLLEKASLLFPDVSSAPVKVPPGDFSICDENHTASLPAVELRAQVSSGPSYGHPPNNLLAKEDHVRGSYQNRCDRLPVRCVSFAFACRGCCHISCIIQSCCIIHHVFPSSVTVVKPRSP